MTQNPEQQPEAGTSAKREGRCASREFCDLRLARRFQQTLEQLSDTGGPSIPFASQDWAQAKAAYRFFSNARVDEHAILSGHMRCTQERSNAVPGPLLILHDTTEISYGSNVGGVGLIGRVARHTVCGILMHSSLVVTLQGLPLGLCAVKFWTRGKFKDTNALKRSINATRVPIEQKESIRWLQNVQQATQLLDCPSRCIHVSDREGDIYELFCAATELHTHFLIRTCADRLCGDGSQTVGQQMAATRARGLHRIEFRDPHGHVCQALLTLSFRRLHLLPSRAKRSRYPELSRRTRSLLSRGARDITARLCHFHKLSFQAGIKLPLSSLNVRLEPSATPFCNTLDAFTAKSTSPKNKISALPVAPDIP